MRQCTTKRGTPVLRKSLLFLSLLSLPVIGRAQSTYWGNWSANSTNGALLRGTWTAVPDPGGTTVRGTWTLSNADGSTAAEGGWSAAKAASAWNGAWRAKVAVSNTEYTGTWTSTADLKTAQFSELFEKAIEAAVSGTWRYAEKLGAWSIRAAPKTRSPESPPAN
jgi:hypothetical protein